MLIACLTGKWRYETPPDSFSVLLTSIQKVLIASFGANYGSVFDKFEPVPFAAASIGQVHRARLSAAVSPTGRVEDVVVKVSNVLLPPYIFAC